LGVQAVVVRVIVLRIVRSVWAAAISAAFFGFPAVLRERRWERASLAA
jgi:hypothetical protein